MCLPRPLPLPRPHGQEHILLTQIPRIPCQDGQGASLLGPAQAFSLDLFSREGTKWLVYSLLNPRDGQGQLFVQSLYKQAKLYTGIHVRCQVMRTRTGLGEKANRLIAGAWDLKELRTSKVEPDLPCTCEYIFIMIGGWIIFCHLQP